MMVKPLLACPTRLTRSNFAVYGVARAEVAQLAEHSPEKAGVDSSILSLGTIIHWRAIGELCRALGLYTDKGYG